MPEPLTVLTGKAVPLAADDVDTDQIIPAQFLKVTEKAGLSRYLFYRWRYDEGGALTHQFVLDRPEFKDSKILLAGTNFGIGSSRENAVWSLLDAGIRCVVASSFGDIFYNNASKNGLLCIRLKEAPLASLRNRAGSGGLTISVDLPSQTLATGQDTWHFEVERHIKECLMSGTDDIGLTVSSYEAQVSRYEGTMPRYALPRH